MIDWMLVARSNDYGLTRDAAILRAAMDRLGVSNAFAERRRRSVLDRLFRRRVASRILHIERAFPAWFGAGQENWLIPNQERYPRRQIGRLRRLSGVFAKTRDAQRIFEGLGVRTVYLGFTSPDRRDPGARKDWGRFFHLAGANTLKGTEDILALWATHPEWPELVLVQKADNAPKSVPPNVTLRSGYLDDGELKRLQNACGIHLCPSRAEGWGHYIVEGLSVGAVVVTTDAAPMNELVTPESGILVPASREEPRHLGVCHFVDPTALETAIERLIRMPASEKAAIGRMGRQRYEAIDSSFHQRCAATFGMGA
ncbi:MAG: glycosyltransferase family 4 protein [Rhizobiaceae bacterium]|nr:glycosyltransferase family 4 protein [Rhizobiaceae bacterium]